MNDLTTALVNGVALGAITAFAALGLHYSFGMLGFVNLVHGEAMLLGGYAAFVSQDHFGSPVLGMVVAPFLAAAVGALVELTLLRRLYRRPLDSLLVTFGIALVIRQSVEVAFTNAPRRVLDPLEGTVSLGDVAFARWRLLLVVFVAVLSVALWWVVERSDVGLRVRAAVANYEMATALGIHAARLRTLVFAIGSAVAGLAGAMLAPLFTLDPQFGLLFLVNALVAVILGRLGSYWGLVVAAFAIGMATTLLQLTMSAVLAQVAVLVIALVAIRVRPSLHASR